MEYNSYTIMLAKIRAFRATKDVVAKSLKQFDVTIMQWLFMGVVAKNGHSTSSELAQELNVSTPLISRFQHQLLEKKLINVTPELADRRNKKVELTTAGRNLLQNSEPVVRDELKLWLSSIPSDDVRTYITVLLQVAYKL